MDRKGGSIIHVIHKEASCWEGGKVKVNEESSRELIVGVIDLTPGRDFFLACKDVD